MQKGFALVYFLSLVLLGIIVLTTPIPYYQSQNALCKPCPLPPQKCPPCPSKGWYLSPSIGSRFISRYIIKSYEQQAVEITFSPQPTTSNDETAKWKTYSSFDVTPSVGATFQYPEDWKVKPVQIFGSRTEVGFEYQFTTTFTLSIIANYNQETGKPYVSLNEYVRQRMDISKDIAIGIYSAKRITATKIPPELSGHVIPYEEVILFTPDKSAIISLYYQKDFYNKSGADKILDQILSTFKFN